MTNDITTIYLIRHAETVWNATRRVQGRLDAPLSERGVRQVARLTNALVGVPFAAVYASPLPRALETARPLAQLAGCDLHLVDALCEIHQGDWESRLLDDLLASDGDRLRAWWTAPHTVRMPGGETLEEVQVRARAAVRALVARHPGQALAVVAHGGVNRTILLDVLGAPLAAYWRLRQHNACVNILELSAGPGRVICLNETVHLGDDAWAALG